MQSQTIIERQPAVVHLPRSVSISGDQLWDICRANPDWQFELSAAGDLIIMPPSGGRTGARNLKLTTQLGQWAESDATGIAFDSSTGFVLPNGAIRSPDAAWVSQTRLAPIPGSERDRFLRVSPDFVVELRSQTDSLRLLQDKMEEYVSNGARLAWLIDPTTRTVFVYLPAAGPQRRDNLTELSADPVLPGFILDLRPIWDPGL